MTNDDLQNITVSKHLKTRIEKTLGEVRALIHESEASKTLGGKRFEMDIYLDMFLMDVIERAESLENTLTRALGLFDEPSDN